MRSHYTLPRLYREGDLSGDLVLSREQSHYLATVMRRKLGDRVRLFNAEEGEVSAEIETIARNAVTLRVAERLRGPYCVPDIRLLFAPVRKHRTAFIVEKATELGVRTLQPVLTARTQFSKFNVDRARAQAIEAAEQTERLDLPEVREPIPLFDALNPKRPLIFADEGGGVDMACDVLAGLAPPLDLLIGPEGGFDESERERLHAQTNCRPVSLGPRILRADTAAVALLTLTQAHVGDWNAT